MNKTIKVKRKTTETCINVELNLYGRGKYEINTGIGFFDHMLELFAKHSLIDLKLNVKGDLRVDEHHTIEDSAFCLGQAISEALGDKKGIRRYGFLLPMDDSLVEIAMDIGGRPYLVFNCEFKREKIGDFPTEMVEHFFRSVSDSLRANIHINVKYGKNEHHKIEAIFKAFAKTLRMAVEKDKRAKNFIPSTKGIL